MSISQSGKLTLFCFQCNPIWNFSVAGYWTKEMITSDICLCHFDNVYENMEMFKHGIYISENSFILYVNRKEMNKFTTLT